MSILITSVLVIFTIWYVLCPEHAPLLVFLIGNAVFCVLVARFTKWILGGIWRGIVCMFVGIG